MYQRFSRIQTYQYIHMSECLLLLLSHTRMHTHPQYFIHAAITKRQNAIVIILLLLFIVILIKQKFGLFTPLFDKPMKHCSL